MRTVTPNSLFLLAILVGFYLGGCAGTSQISYHRDVQPILADKCVACHTPPYGEGYRKTGLSMVSYQTLMEGSIYGPVIIAGNSQASPLNMLVEGRAGDLMQQMAKRHQPITEQEVTVLRLWVQQGALNN